MRKSLLALLLAAATARLLLQMLAMPPYAGLDELFHVARLAFVIEEGRQPRIDEPSIPRYLGESGAVAFGLAGARWAEVKARSAELAARPVTATKPYVSVNYQAQHASLYYWIAAPLGKLARTERAQLMVWRALSLIFTLIAVAATAAIARSYAAAALLVCLPNFLTLTLRVSNDALAVALVTCALAVTIHRKNTWLEALLWAGALATKLYTWPIAIALPLLWWRQKASRRRIAIVCLLCAVAVGATMWDLAERTKNPFGHFVFDPPQETRRVPIDYAGIAKVLVSSGVWMSGQHLNALRPWAMAVYVLPIIVLLMSRGGAADSAAHRRRVGGGSTGLVLAVVVAFGIAQLVDLAGAIRLATTSMPDAGKEGWYWYAIAPLIVAMLFPRRPILLAVWLIAWDVLLHESILFHDFAGTTSPATPSAIARWGPLHFPIPSALRWIHLAATAALFRLESVLQGSSSDD